MGYSNFTLIQQILNQALTTSSPRSLSTPTDLIKIGNTLDSNLIPTATVDQYIQFADSEIDAALSELYITPFCEKANFETTLLTDINDYMGTTYVITSISCPFNPLDIIILTNGTVEERHTIESIVNIDEKNVFQTVSPILNEFLVYNTRVIRVGYPEPIPLISARLAAARIYEKYFMSQTSTNSSDYGNMLVKQARQQLNNVLNGRTILHGCTRIGRRFFNPNLSDRYGLPNTAVGDNDMDDIS